MKKQRFILPRNVKYIISRLNEHGYRAAIVGGSVRDILLGKSPSDYDITTSATPEEMKRVFSEQRTVETGIKHGTLSVILDGEQYELTTYRLDGEYTDNRHPNEVSFTREIGDDLARRDFTVNAMAYNECDGLTDMWGGIRDLENGLIRAVGNPERRFTEDALRIMRALRFAATLDFEIEAETAAAARKCKELIRNVSAERIFTEWKKLLAGKGAYRVLSEFSDIPEFVIPSLKPLTLPAPERFAAASGELRELSLFAPLESPSSAYDTALRTLKSDNKRRLFGLDVLSLINAPLDSEEGITDALLAHGENVTREAIALKTLLGAADDSALILDGLISSGICYRLSELALGGTELAALGLSGTQIGAELNRILRLVAHRKIENTAEAIFREVSKK